MSHDFSLPEGKQLTLTVTVKDKDILQYLLVWQNRERVSSEEGLKMLDHPVIMGLELDTIGLTAPFSGDINRVRELMAELNHHLGVKNGN